MVPTKFQFIWFQRRIFLEIDQSKPELPVVAMFVNGSKLNEQSLLKTLYIWCLPLFGSFGQAVLEKKIKKKYQSEARIAYGGHVFSELGQTE